MNRPNDNLSPEQFREPASSIEAELAKSIVGMNEVVRHVLVGILCNGHVLLEGIPGLGKTMLVASVDYNRACDELTNGRYDEAWRALEAVQDSFRALDDPFGVALVDADLAELALGLGACEPAQALAASARSGFEAIGSVLDTARWLVGDDLALNMPFPVMGAEDFSYVTEQVPGAMAFLGTRPGGVRPAEVAPNHSNRMVLDEGAMATGVALYAATALHRLVG